MNAEERKRRKVLWDRFTTASSALFDVESGLGELGNDRRQAVYRLRVELGRIQSAEISKHEREEMLTAYTREEDPPLSQKPST